VRLRSAGHVIPEMQVRLFDADRRDVTATGRGQPGCRGALMSPGYWDDPAANAQLFTADGWMLTGDIAELGPDGVLSVVGRTADIIIRGGKNISAPVVEAAVMAHPAVALAAAVPVPDPVFGERVCAVVELHAGRSLTLDELVAHLRAQGVSVESWPERLLVLDELPRASGGKIAKGELRKQAAQRLSQRRGHERPHHALRPDADSTRRDTDHLVRGRRRADRRRIPAAQRGDRSREREHRRARRLARASTPRWPTSLRSTTAVSRSTCAARAPARPGRNSCASTASTRIPTITTSRGAR
jgi:hypothetical protein